MGEIKIGRMVLGTCSTNTYFVYREGSQDAVVIDPADYGEHIYESLQKNGFQVAAILLTHGHFDHIWGCEKLRALSGVKVYANEAERDLLGDARKNISAQAGRACTLHADEYLKDGDVLEVGQRLKFFHVELRTIETFFHVFRITVRIGKQVFKLNEIVLAAFAFIEYFTTAVDAFRTVFAGHGGTPVLGEF